MLIRAWREARPRRHLSVAGHAELPASRTARNRGEGTSVSQQHDEPAETRRSAEHRQNVLMAISNEIVRLYKLQFGRGPTKARTYWGGSDVLSVVLEDTLTPAERNLVNMGEHQRLRDTRIFFQYASVRDFCEPVERLTGRKVRAFISGVDTEADGLSAELFILHPEGYDGPSRTADAEP
jgi:uncharacterized protein YbcI